MRKGKSALSGLAERRRERGKGRTQGGWSADAHHEQRRWMAPTPFGFLCDVLSNESAPDEERKEAAEELLPYYHPKLAKMGPVLRRFLCKQQ